MLLSSPSRRDGRAVRLQRSCRTAPRGGRPLSPDPEREEESCVVCWDATCEASFGCGHSFCKRCAAETFRRIGKCPMCRSAIRRATPNLLSSFYDADASTVSVFRPSCNLPYGLSFASRENDVFVWSSTRSDVRPGTRILAVNGLPCSRASALVEFMSTTCFVDLTVRVQNGNERGREGAHDRTDTRQSTWLYVAAFARLCGKRLH